LRTVAIDVEFQKRTALGCELVAEVVRRFGGARLNVSGGSMLPAVWPGDVITVRPHNIATLRPGHVVLYRREGRLVPHRITCIRGGVLTTRGDSVGNDDPPVSESDLVGQVVCVEHDGRCLELKQSSWQRMGSFLLQRSDFCRRLVLCLGRLRRRGSYASKT
jgi:signal peptidase I